MSEPLASPTPITLDDLIAGYREFSRLTSAAIREFSGPARDAIAAIEAFKQPVIQLFDEHREEIRKFVENFRPIPAWTPADGYH